MADRNWKTRVITNQYCIICAKMDELHDVISVLDEEFPDRPRNSGSDSVVRIIQKEDEGPPTTVYATCTPQMGNVHSAVKTAQVIINYEPQLVFFVGTAASMAPSKIRLGDVVIPNRAHYHFYEKIVEEGQPEYADKLSDKHFQEFFMDNNALLYNTDISIINGSAATTVSRLNNNKIKLEDAELPENWAAMLKQQRGPKIENDVEIVSCGMVVNSGKFKDILGERTGRKAQTIDMESFGFFQAVQDLRDSEHVTERSLASGIMVRGISDYAREKDDTEGVSGQWKRVATRNAARVTCELIRSHYKSVSS